MGSTKATTRISSLNGKNGQYEAEFLVDTCATDPMAPADDLN